MILYSITDPTLQTPLKDAVMKPQAADGGLYLPLHIPKIPAALFRHLSEFSLNDIAYIVANQMFGDDIDSATLQSIVKQTLTFDLPLRQIHDNIWSLELYHGPSQSFKDIGIGFLSQLLKNYHSSESDEPINLIVATAGPAVETIVKAFSDIHGVRVFILYPESRSNRMEFSHWGCKSGNILPIEVEGSFDDCNAMIKRALTDNEIAEHMTLSSANTLNIARLLPQTIYYFWAYAQLMHNGAKTDSLLFSVPSGNFGNLCAGVIAKRMGLPITRFIAAENINCPFNRYLLTGTASDIPTTPTLAGALDVNVPGNLPRLLQLYDGNIQAIKNDIFGAVIDDNAIAATIRSLYNDNGYLINPNSAVAYRALLENIKPEQTGVFIATAAPEKARHEIVRLLDTDPFTTPEQKAIHTEIRPTRMSATFLALKKFLLTQ